MKKIFFFTSSRSDFGIQLPLIRKFLNSKVFKTYTIITGSHFSKQYGRSINEVIKSGIKNQIKINYNYNPESQKSISSFLSKLMLKISDIFQKMKPNYLILLGDRFELIVPATIANHYKIPIIHLHGGEVTEGSMDELTRHAISKMSHLHFPCTENYKKRLIQLGENPKNIHNFGSINLSDIKNLKLVNKKDLLTKLKILNQNKNILVTFHPEFDFNKKSTIKNFNIICEVLSDLENTNIVFTAPAQELYSDTIIKMINQFCAQKKNGIFIKSMGKEIYFSCLKHFNLMVGNSSSGIIEAPYFNIPVVNMGKRQSGRDLSINILNCEYNKKDFFKKIKYALSVNFKKKLKNNKPLYYKNNSVEKIYKKILSFGSRKDLTKKFFDI